MNSTPAINSIFEEKNLGISKYALSMRRAAFFVLIIIL